MQDSNIPTKFPIPFANNAGPGFVRPIPQASQIGITPGAASLTDGFPPLNFNPVAAGGIPPFGEDMNGILLQITQWIRWLTAGAPLAWDSTYATAIGGYPLGAKVLSAGGSTVHARICLRVRVPSSRGLGRRCTSRRPGPPGCRELPVQPGHVRSHPRSRSRGWS